MTEDFVHLHVHSEYSLLDGMGRTGQMAKRAAGLGQPALALTDHGVMHGAIEFARACKKEGVKPILGVEAYLTHFGRPMSGRDSELDKDRYHLLLLAENMTGYRNLLKLCSDAQFEGYYYKPRIDAEYLAAHKEGIICLSGCLAAELPTLLANGQEDQALERLRWYRDVFGPEHWYVEFQEHDIPELTQVNKQLFAFAKEFDVPMVVTNDAHYVYEKDANPHDVLLCVQTGALINDAKRLRYDGMSYFLKSLDQMRQTFLPLIDLPDSAFTNTVKIAEMCDVDPEDNTYHLPDIAIPKGYNYETYLRHLTEEGLRWRYNERADSPEVRARTAHELKIIHEMGFDVYYLIVWDLCMYAKRRGIWWNIRGSGAGSIVAYAIGVTNLDPLRNKLIFERFLNPGRVTMPDFDLDFPDDQREELIRYTVEKYGNHRVAQVVTFGRMKARAAVRDVGRAMGVELAEVDSIAKMIPAIPGKPVTIQDVLNPEHEFYAADLKRRYDEEEQVHELLDTGSHLEGVARHSSIHAAAVIIADKELTYYTPLMRPPKSAVTETVTQYEYPILESIGLLKVDFLGLATLTLMRECGRLIKERHGIEYTLQNLPIDDPKIYELLTAGDVMGVFQVEGQGMRRVLMEMRPTEFDHIVATISLYRPGPMEFIPDFIACLHGEKEPSYIHKILTPILSETMGVCVSGDALVMDARTGRRCRLDQAGDSSDLFVQGVDEEWRPAAGRVTHWIDSGYKPVYRVTLRNGAHIKVTANHRLLTEDGWRPLQELQPGDYIATPTQFLGPDADAPAIDRRKLRVLAYLIADGSLTSGTMVDFVSKEPAMLAEYERCLAAFDDVSPSYVVQVREVTRIGAAKRNGSGQHYHAPNTLLSWLRELGLKYLPGAKPGGAHSRDKFVPDFVFELAAPDLAFFLASLWEGDGYMGSKLCHYRTISPRLAGDVQALLLRLGVSSTIHVNYYSVQRDTDVAERLPSYQVTVYDTKRLAGLLQPHMVTAKAEVLCRGVAEPDISRVRFMDELATAWSGSQKGLMRATGFDRQHFRAQHRQRERIPARCAALPAHNLTMPATARCMNIIWQKIMSIEPVGVEHVYDLTVEGLHSFVANGIIVHNCVYQEQVIQILADIAGYTPGEADLVRRGISKKSKKTLDEHREIFAEGSKKKSGLKREEADAIWDALMGFARYGFNRAHAADYAVIVAQTAFLKAYYPVEYMAALLTVERHDTEKVGVLIAECRRMGIEVLPPNVSVSGHMFTIERLPDDRPALHQGTAFQFPVPERTAIRMGMDAIKNVGEGPVDAILQARGDRPFGTLADFADRVDLRQVNRRGLECLIKVGALDDFGERGQLLAGIDRIMAASEAAHTAREVGQLTLFGGADTESAEELLASLPTADKANPKDALDWEKELVGVYVSSHPLQKMTVDLKDIVTHASVDVTEELAGRNVVVAGMVADVRQITTKKGDTMAFVRLEDLQGTIDITVFPRLYADQKAFFVLDKIIVVNGKADVRNGRVSVVADTVRDYVEGMKVIEDTGSVAYRYRNGAGSAARPQFKDRASAPAYTSPARAFVPSMPEGDEDEEAYLDNANPFAGEEPEWLAEQVADERQPTEDRRPPTADQGTKTEDQGPTTAERQPTADSRSEERSAVPAALAAASAPANEPVATSQLQTPAEPAQVRGNGNAVKAVSPASAPSAQADRMASQAGAKATAHETRPVRKSGAGSEARPAASTQPSAGSRPPSTDPAPSGPRTVHITFRRTASLDNDRRRLAGLVDVLSKYNGNDHFEIIVEAGGAARWQLDFPNNHTRVCRELEAELAQRLGASGWRVVGQG